MIRYFHGQKYVAIGLRPYTRRDGKLTNLLVWQSTCAECGAPFTFMLPARKERWEPNRRCDQHKRPGRRVRKVVP